MSDVEAETLLSSAPSLPRALFIRLCWRLLPILWLGYVLNIVDPPTGTPLQMTGATSTCRERLLAWRRASFCAYALESRATTLPTRRDANSLGVHDRLRFGRHQPAGGDVAARVAIALGLAEADFTRCRII